MKFEDNEFDGLLNETLKEVAKAEPRMGLEGRVFANIRSDGREEKTVWWKWAAVAAMVILIVLGLAVRRGTKSDVVAVRPAKAVPETPKAVTPQPNVASQDVASASDSAKRIKRREGSKARPVQKVESETAKVSFPAPAPMNDQEKALVMLAQNHPQVLRSVAIDSDSDEPLAIPKLKIDPIKVSGNGEEER